jgi:hypothetical protein
MTAPKPIIAPGPSPHGPPGWEEKQQQRLSSGQLTNDKQSSNYHDDTVVDAGNDHLADTGFETVNHDPNDKIIPDEHHDDLHRKTTVKDKLHHIGEKLAIVPPLEKDEHGNPLQFSAHRQVCVVSSIG